MCCINNHDNSRSVHRPSSVKPVQVVCHTCGKSVAGKKRLLEHIQRKHNSIFSCKDCDKQFKSIEELKLHRIKAHKPVIKPQENNLSIKLFCMSVQCTCRK